MKPIAVLVVYAYSSFVSQWGMGPDAAREFEKLNNCKVELVNAGDAGSMLSRLKLEGAQTRADLVLGLDETILPKASKVFTWRKLMLPKRLKWSQGIGPMNDLRFLPFDHGPYAFIYNSEKLSAPPRSLNGLLDGRFKGRVLLEDPRTSSVGLGFLLWTLAAKKEGAWDFLRQIVTTQTRVVSPSWDLAYGMFKKGEGDLVLSYWSSPAYHIQEEKVAQYKAAPFSEGHYEQVEYLAIPSTGRNRELADKFVAFVYSDFFQQLVMKKNFMLPVRSDVALTPAFKELGSKPKLLRRFSQEEIEKSLDVWREKWRTLF